MAIILHGTEEKMRPTMISIAINYRHLTRSRDSCKPSREQSIMPFFSHGSRNKLQRKLNHTVSLRETAILATLSLMFVSAGS